MQFRCMQHLSVAAFSSACQRQKCKIAPCAEKSPQTLRYFWPCSHGYTQLDQLRLLHFGFSLQRQNVRPLLAPPALTSHAPFADTRCTETAVATHRPQPPTEIKLRFQKGGGPSSSLSSHRAFRHLCAVLHTRCLVPSAHPCR